VLGFLDIFKQTYNKEVLGEQTIEAVVVVFEKIQKARPYEEPHESLATTWINRIGGDVNSQTAIAALHETFLHACIRPPLCARSLGLYFLYKENPQIISEFPKFAVEYNTLMAPVFKAQEDGTFMALYSKYNPKMAQIHLNAMEENYVRKQNG
jgi:hypothetical protein